MFILGFLTFLLFLNVYVHGQEHFEIIHQWRYINFTWPSISMYQSYVDNRKYIPANVFMDGIKVYDDKVFINMPKNYDGIPVTLGYISINDAKDDLLITPFPSWEMNVGEDCNTLQSVQATEIDTEGIIWIIDGTRWVRKIPCPPKLVLININTKEIVHVKVFPNEICLHDGGSLNDIVIDESDGGWAYITDDSPIDPGLIVYSRATDRVWKLRDKTMYGDVNTLPIVLKGSPENSPPYDLLLPIDGIALSPKNYTERFVYYCSLFGYDLYSISTNVLKNEELCRTFNWRRLVNYVGRRPSQSDGMTIDNEGNLYITLETFYAIGRWNINTPFNIEIIDQNPETMLWLDSFAFDNNGSIYVLTDNVQVFSGNINHYVPDEPLFRIFKRHTGTKSYMYS